MITDDPARMLHLWRLAYSVDEMPDEAVAATFQQMVADTSAGPDREAIRRLCADAAALRQSDPWLRALRVMRELRWSSY